ncbi:MAG: 16S rRNA (guanine(527)-N(7))-methyltransferase RsmG [Candidatus Flexifilum sp.]|jgi:16S rRNA (guanine527-N7)-methyltransferase
MSDSLAALRTEAAAFGIPLSDHQLGQFAIYQRELAAWNAHTNLTAITSDEGVRVRHFLDSLTVARVVDLSAPLRVIDVGTGAGFPGLALRIAFPHLHMALLEATGKKLTFLRHVCAQMGIDTGVEFIHQRAEEAGQTPGQREAYDLVLARAVARLPILLEYLLPLARVGGRCVALKGTTAEAEAADSARALARLGGRLTSIARVDLPGVDEPHYLVVVEKVAPTPPSYPRKPGIPSQRPL